MGGWGMYPTTLFGLVLLCAAVMYAVRPDRRRIRIVRNLGLLTLLSGTLGFVTGAIKTCGGASSMPSHEVANVVMGGVGESLNNVGLALSMLIMPTIITTVGAVRSAAQSGKSELIAPSA